MEQQSDHHRRGEAAAEISKQLVGLHRESYGRGADRAKTIIQDDYVVTFLDGIFTVLERRLVDAGRFQHVRETRAAFQELMRDTFTEVVERATGRTVIAFFSEIHAHPDMAVEAFVLEPSSYEPSS